MNAASAEMIPTYVQILSGAVENENNPSSANRQSLKNDQVERVSFARMLA